MSSKKMITPAPASQERRLKPIYELLDTGNNRKALAEVERVLQKSPNNPLAQVVKALALIRMDRDDEARSILKQVLLIAEGEGLVVGDTTQILLTCYKELREPQMICAVLEALSSKVKSEDLMVQYFMSLVRVQDHQKMYQTAISLYKTFHNSVYFSWAIASLVLHHDDFIGPFEFSTSLSFQLAERMIDKYLAEEKERNEETKDHWRLLDLYLRLLIRHSANWDKVLGIFKIKGYPPQELSLWSWNRDHEHYCLAMEQAGLKLELLKYLQDLFKEHKDYALLKQIADVFGSESTDETIWNMVVDFINDLRKNHPSFAVAMGSLYFTTHVNNKRYTEARQKELIEEDLKMLIDFGMDKVNFFPEAVEQFKLADHALQCKLVDRMATHAITAENIEQLDLKSLTNTEIIKDINYEFAQREVMAKKFDTHQCINQANFCFGKYLKLRRAREDTVALSSPQDDDTTKEVDYLDQYVLIAASILISEHCKLGKKVSEEENETELCSTFEASLSVVDGLNTTEKKTGRICPDGLIHTAICLLEQCLGSSPYDCTLRFMLGNAYARCGATLEMLNVVQEINVKHVQWDSLGYLLFPLVLSTGTYSEALMMLKQADSMYVTYEKESMEFVIAAYDHCSFKEAHDFYIFRDLLLQSTQFGLVLVERRLHELIVCAHSTASLSKLCELVCEELNLSEMMKIACYDNRDLSQLENLFDDEIDWNVFRKASASIDKNWLKVRLSLLTVIVKMVNTVINKMAGDFDSDDGDSKLDVAADLEKDAKLWEKFCQEWKELKEDESLETPYFGIYPSLRTPYFQLSIPDYLIEQVKCVIKLVKQKGDDDVPAATVVNVLTNLEQVMGQQATKLVNIGYNKFSAYLSEPKSGNVEEFIRDLAWITEFFTFSKIFLTVAVTAAKDSQGKGGGKSKGKKGKSAKEISIIISSILGRLQEFRKLLEEVKQFLNTRPLSTWPNSKFTETGGYDAASTKFLIEAFPTTYNDVQKNIHHSHVNQVLNISRVVELMIHFISNLT